MRRMDVKKLENYLKLLTEYHKICIKITSTTEVDEIEFLQDISLVYAKRIRKFKEDLATNNDIFFCSINENVVCKKVTPT